MNPSSQYKKQIQQMKSVSKVNEKTIQIKNVGMLTPIPTAIKLNTPVDTGRMRQSWQVGQDGPKPGVSPEIPKGQKDSSVKDAKFIGFTNPTIGHDYSIHNNRINGWAISCDTNDRVCFEVHSGLVIPV